MKKIYFVRHGEAEGNVTQITQNELTPLTETGHKQAMIVADRVAKLGIEKVFASSMVRATDTGKYIADKLGLGITLDPVFREWMTPNSVRGRRHDSLEYQAWIEALRHNHHDLDWRYEDAENFSDLENRLRKATSLLESDDSDSILVVSHGKFLKLLLAYILTGKKFSPEIHLQISDTSKASNTGITLFEVENRDWCLVTWNDRAHFADN